MEALLPPNISQFEFVLIVLCSVATSYISGVIGMAGGVTLLGVLTFFFPHQILIPVHGVVQLVSNMSRSVILRKHIIKPLTLFYTLGIPLGTAISAYVIVQIENPETYLILVAILIFYVLFKPKKLPDIRLPFPAYGGVGLVAGFLNLLIGATGPFIAVFFVRKDFAKEQIVATKATTQAIGHLFKIAAYGYIGFNFQKYIPLLIAMSLGAIIGTKLGVHTLGKISEKWFRIAFKSFLFLAALRIIFKVLAD